MNPVPPVQNAPNWKRPWMGSPWSLSLDPRGEIAQLPHSMQCSCSFITLSQSPHQERWLRNAPSERLIIFFVQVGMWHLSTFLLTVLKQARARVSPWSWLWWMQRSRLHGLEFTRRWRASAGYDVTLRHQCWEMTRIFRQKWQLRQGLWNQPSCEPENCFPQTSGLSDDGQGRRPSDHESGVTSLFFLILFFAVLEIEPMALRMPGQCPTTELQCQPAPACSWHWNRTYDSAGEIDLVMNEQMDQWRIVQIPVVSSYRGPGIKMALVLMFCFWCMSSLLLQIASSLSTKRSPFQSLSSYFLRHHNYPPLLILLSSIFTSNAIQKIRMFYF